jgi:predicted nucleic acid-binding protein
MSRVVVADAGPLIALARISRLDLLHEPYGPVLVPPAVLGELELESDRPGARALSGALSKGCLEVIAPAGDASRLRQVLDPGEAEAIQLAEEIECRFLLIDERRGRTIARRRGIPIVGTGGLLLGAKRAGRLSSVTPELQRLTEIGYRLAPALVEEVRRLAEEL